MRVQGWHWKVDLERKLILATYVITVDGKPVGLEVKASTELKTAVPKLIKYMTTQIRKMNDMTVRRSLRQMGLKPRKILGIVP